MNIRLDDLSSPEVHALLAEHLRSMAQWSPPESVHALDLDALRRPEIAVWTAWSANALLGCGALKELTPAHGEIKSMRTAKEFLGRGVARRMLSHIIATAKRRGYSRLSLETGSGAAFEPALALYAKFGFRYCGPFAGYREDPFSRFMTLELR